MEIAILSWDRTLYSCKRLHEAAMQRGHLIEVIDPLSCYMNISPAASSIRYKGRQLPHFNVAIPWTGSAVTLYGTVALRQLEMLDSYPLNESAVITRMYGKLRPLQLLVRQGIDLPITGIAHSPDDTSDMIDMVGGTPSVAKLVEGTQGIDVVLMKTRQATESMVNAFHGVNAHVLVQKYIKEARGRDIRCFVVSDKIVTTIERRAKEGDFRSSPHCGGMTTTASTTPRERKVALKAARMMGLNIADVDILHVDREPLVMEVSAPPGLEGVRKTTGIDIAAKVIQWIKRHAAPEFCLKVGG